MGAMVLTLDNGKRLELSGFTDAERFLGYSEADKEGRSDADVRQWAEQHPETECPEWMEATNFPRGTRVSFKYRGLTDAGIPNEARYWRKDERL